MAASASTKVVCYGDSITAGDRTNDYVSKLAALRPDLTFVNYGRGGDVTENRQRFGEMLTSEHPNIVVLMLGTNDPVCYGGAPPPPTCRADIATPRRTAVDLLRMARAAVVSGASVYVLHTDASSLPRRCSM